jgi:tellurite resistance protein
LGRKRKSANQGGLAIVFVILIGLLASIPKEVWIGIAIFLLAALAYKIFRNFNNKKKAAQLAIQVPSAGRSTTVAKTISTSRPVTKVYDTNSLVSMSIGLPQQDALDHPVAPPPVGFISSKSRWVPRSEQIEVAGLTIQGGMLYFGTSVRDSYRREEPSLINPNISVSKVPVDPTVKLTSYWPNYSEITPDARRAYLDWLADGRKNPQADIGYVFLFFYGLERRALIDAASSEEARKELPLIVDEIKRLISIYKQSSSFHRYAADLLEYVHAAYLPQDNEEEFLTGEQPFNYQLPISLRIRLGRFAIAREPLPAAWAIRWVLSDVSIYRRTAATRCAAEFTKIFEALYKEKYGDGIILPVNSAKLKIQYMAASAALRGTQLMITPGDLPDITAISGPRNKLQTLVNDCTKALDAYSRFLGRHPDQANSFEAYMCLPTKFWPETIKSAFARLKQEATNQFVLLNQKDLSAQLHGSGNFTRECISAMAGHFEEMGLGIEPDVVGGARRPGPDDLVVIFSLNDAARGDRSTTEYKTALLTVNLFAAIVAADGDASDSELRLVEQQIDTWEGLSTNLKSRLKANYRLQLKQVRLLPGLKEKLGSLSTDSRRSIGVALASLARADGNVSPHEITLLQKLYGLLQLDPQLVYADLNERTLPSQIKSGRARPAQSGSPSARGFALNADKIAALQRESASVSSLLADVFTDDEPVVQPSPVEAPEGDVQDTLIGLDAGHSEFLRLLISRPEWSRQELAGVAVEMKMMLDGALERINEAAFDAVGVSITDGDDPIEVNQKTVEMVFA